MAGICILKWPNAAVVWHREQRSTEWACSGPFDSDMNHMNSWRSAP